MSGACELPGRKRERDEATENEPDIRDGKRRSVGEVHPVEGEVGEEEIIEGAGLAVSTWDILSGDVAVGENVLLYDDNAAHPGLAAAEPLNLLVMGDDADPNRT